MDLPQVMSDKTYVKELIEQLAPAKHPTILYHYTSAAGLQGIVESKSIWSTSIRYLNDSQEYELALDLAFEALENAKSFGTTELRTGLYEVMSQSLEDVHGTEIFVSSFSEHGDQLSQWRGYSPVASGYAVGFDVDGLLTSQDEYRSGFLAPCIYNSETQIDLVDSLIEHVVQFAHDFEEQQKKLRKWDDWDLDRDQFFRDERDRTYREAYKLFARLLPVLGPVIKHGTFSEESEWRLISQTPFGTETKTHLRAGTAMLIPYILHPLTLKDNRLQFSEIIVGPTPHPELAVHAVELLLERNNAVAKKIRNSEIPYRDW